MNIFSNLISVGNRFPHKRLIEELSLSDIKFKIEYNNIKILN